MGGLTKEQKRKKISEDPLYWEYFRKWWDEDFSWDGLAKRPCPELGPTHTLQDAFSSATKYTFADREWTEYHLPLHDLDGNPSEKQALFDNHPHGLEPWKSWLISAASHKAYMRYTGICFPDNFEFPKWNTNIEISGKIQWWITGKNFKFDEVRPTSATTISNCLFADNTFIRITSPGNYSSILDTAFIGKSHLSNCRFGTNFQFQKVVFSGEVYFTSSNFGNKSGFTECEFLGKANFDRAEFREDNHFTDCTFHDEVTFRGANIFKRLTFGGERPAHFLKSATFQFVLNKSDVADCRGLNFDHVKFDGFTSFSDSEFPKQTSFKSARFNKLTDFHSVEFRTDTNLNDARFALPVEDSDDASDYQDAFRVLRQEMERTGNMEQTQKFRRHEMMSRDLRPKSSETVFGEKSASTLYRWSSNYGSSLVRPIIGIASLFTFATVGYFLIVVFSDPLIGFPWLDAMHAASKYSLPPLSTSIANTLGGGDAYFENLLSSHPFWRGLIAWTQGILSPVFLFFLLLALKRRFQVK